MKILLDFGKDTIEAELFETRIGRNFYEKLPVKVELTNWGKETYGEIGYDFGQENPVPAIPEGGIAYTNRGNLVCIFYGQTPAWAVDHIGQIPSPQWNRLSEIPLKQVEIKKL